MTRAYQSAFSDRQPNEPMRPTAGAVARTEAGSAFPATMAMGREAVADATSETTASIASANGVHAHAEAHAGNGHAHTSHACDPETGGTAEETFVVPASLEQTRYWTLAQIDPDSTASNMAISCELEGAVDARVLEQAVAALTLRHEALRTLFRVVDGQLSQIILTRPVFEFKEQDLRGPDGADAQEAQIAAALSAHSHLRIDLEQGPVLRARLLRLSAERYQLALTMNHIVCDGWSNGLLLRDVLHLYGALLRGAGPLEAVVSGAASDLPELPFQFADFTVWQNEYLGSPQAATALRFWMEHIPGDLPPIAMPADRPRQAGRSFPGTIASTLLPADVNKALIAYCRQSGSTKHIVLLSIFEALCARESGQDRFLLGSTIANRTQPGMEDVVGRFANPQIIVADVTGDPTFRSLEQRVREWESSAYTHQDLPFSRIIEELQSRERVPTSQFLSVWFVYQRAFMQPQQMDGLRLTPRRSVSGGVDFDMLVSVVEREEGPRLQIEYNSDLFAAERIAGLLDRFEHLLTEALAHPDVPLSELSVPDMLVADLSVSGASSAAQPSVAAAQPATETITVMNVPVASSAAEPIVRSARPVAVLARAEQEGDLLDRIAAHVAARPGEVAVATATDQITWQQLEQRSRSLAAHIAGTANGRTAARCAYLVLAPDVHAVVALLALLRLGDRGPRLLPLPAHVTAGELADLVTPDTLTLGPAKRLGGVPAAQAIAFESFDTLASGSRNEATADGKLGTLPQAWSMPRVLHGRAQNEPSSTVSINLGETCRSVAMLRRELPITAEDALLAIAPASPSDALLDLLLALSTGASLTWLSFRPDVALQSLLNERQPTFAIAEPGQWRSWAAAGWKGDRRLHALARGRHAAYPGWLPTAAGRPLPVRSAHALLSTVEGYLAAAPVVSGDDTLNFTPLGDLPVRIANRGATSGVLLAHGDDTGYLAESTTEGTFRVIGESRSLVTLAGRRVRLSDYERVLLAMPAVIDAAVRLERPRGEAEFVTVWVTGGPGLDPARLQAAVAERMAGEPRPGAVYRTQALPLYLDGSVNFERLYQPVPATVSDDLDAAAAPEDQPSSEQTDALSPTDDVSRELARIWKEVLHVDTVQPHDSFFQSGGNSLLLVRLFARINKSFGTRLPITTIFEADTPAKLAVQLRRQTEVRSMVPVQPQGQLPPVFMIHSYLLYQALSRALGHNQPFYGLRELEQDNGLDMRERVANYAREIRAIQPHGPYSVMGWCAAGPLTVELARHLIAAGEPVASVILFDSWLPGYLRSVETGQSDDSLRRRWQTLTGKVHHHQDKMRGLTLPQRLRYFRSTAAHGVLVRRDRFFIRHWGMMNMLATRFRLPLPQFMYNTSLTTFAAMNAYQPQPVPVRLTLIRASDTRDVPGASAACGWEKVAMHGVDVLWAPGDHETMFLGEHLEVTTEMVRRCLEHAQSSHAAGPTARTASPAQADQRLAHVGTV